MKRTAIALACGAGLTAAAGVGAQEVLDDRWYMSPMLSYVLADNDRSFDGNAPTGAPFDVDTDDGPGLYLGFGRAINRWLGVEVNMQGNNFDIDDDIPGDDDLDDWQLRGGAIDGLLFLSRNPTFSPYLLVGGGWLRTKVGDDESTTNPMAEAGIGFMSHAFSEDLAFRMDARHRTDFNNDTIDGESSFSDWVFNVGVAYYFGSKPKPKPAPKPQPVVQAPPPPPPPPPPPAPVVKETVVLEGINFCFDCDHLDSTAKRILDTDARKIIDANVESDIEIAGHTDSIGTEAYNEDLSQRRVDSARRYLVQQGVDASRLIAKGYGEREPIADNGTKQGRQRNRRVELRVYE